MSIFAIIHALFGPLSSCLELSAVTLDRKSSPVCARYTKDSSEPMVVCKGNPIPTVSNLSKVVLVHSAKTLVK
jgi:hypothetical protein